MSSDTTPKEATDEKPTAEGAEPATNQPTTEESEITSPDFQELDGSTSNAGGADLSRIQNIQIEITAELGRATIPIQKLMSVTEGTVFELNREVDSPIDLCAQGTRLATGEVVVVDGHFAIRIIEVYENEQKKI